MNAEPAGIKDVDGNDVMLGDIIELWFCMFHGIQSSQFKNSKKCGVKIVDVICRQDEPSPIPGHTIKTYIAMNTLGVGVWAKRLDGVCKIVGKFPQDSNLLVDGSPLYPQNGPEHDKLIEEIKRNPLVLKGDQVRPL